MKKVKKTYVRFFYRGTIVSETTVTEVKERNPKALELPEGAYAFLYYDKTDVHDGDEIFEGKAENHSPTYWPGGEIFTVDDVQKLPGNNRILIQNMVYNNYDRMVRSCKGNFQPFEEGEDVIL
jgi:hypothetical protein